MKSRQNIEKPSQRRDARRWRILRSERGQMLALMAISSVALIGVSSLVLDVGAAFRGHRKAQSAADGSALAAAQMLPTSPAQANIASQAVAAKNLSDGTVSLSIPGGGTYVANDTAIATAATTTPAFLSKVLGFSVFSESATATAITGSYTGWSKGMSPWVTDKASIQWGQIITFKVMQGNQASSGNFGAARLPVNENGCTPASGGSDYRKLIGGSYNSCLVQIGSQLDPETGNVVGPTGQGLSDRGVIQNFNPYSILTQQPDSTYVLNTYTHPNLIVIPVIDQFNNGNSNPMTVTGFAWFIITSYTSKEVSGMFIGSSAPGGAQCNNGGGSTSCPIGGYSPYGFKVVYLIK